MPHSIFVTGGTGYIGSRLIPLLATRGHQIRALVRAGSEGKLPSRASGIVGDALKMDSYSNQVRGADTFIHLIGVPHPSPAKAKQFHEVDLVSVKVAIKAARDAGIRHFIYLSVAQPAPMMKEFIAVRSAGEAMIRQSGINATFVRPWYVLGPGHWWPLPLLPVYWVLERLPATRESALRLGLVSLGQIVNALVWSVETPAGNGIRVIEVTQIRKLGQKAASLDQR